MSEWRSIDKQAQSEQVVWQAQGILMARHGLSASEAEKYLASLARLLRAEVSPVAQRLVEHSGMRS